MPVRRVLIPLLSAALLATACDESNAPATEQELFELGSKADGLMDDTLVVGTLDYGQTSEPIDYRATPRYRAFRFEAGQGDRVEASVSLQGDHLTPLVWILDADFEVQTGGMELSREDGRATVRAELDVETGGEYWIFTRVQHGASARLEVNLDGELPTAGCDEDNPVQREAEARDNPMPRQVLSYIRSNDWGCMHREWHDVRMLSFLVGPETQYIADYHPDWVRVDPQEGAPGNGLEFLAMHRVMLSMLRAEFPEYQAELAGWALGDLPIDPNDPEDPVPGTPTPFDANPLRAVTAIQGDIGNIVSDGLPVLTDDDFGRYIETRRRPVEGVPWGLARDRSTGLHNYMHGRFNDPNSPIRMGNFARNIEGAVFWKLHGWIDSAWTHFRQTRNPGLNDADDPVYMAAMDRACAEMMALHGGHAEHVHWNPDAFACQADHEH